MKCSTSSTKESGIPVENPVYNVLRQGIIVGLANHTTLIAKDGVRHPIADSGAPIRNERGETIGVVLVFNDQSERKLLQAQFLCRRRKWKQSAGWREELAPRFQQRDRRDPRQRQAHRACN